MGMDYSISNKKIFITGGAGFIGSTLIGRLVSKNEIVVFDNMARDALSRQPYASHENLTVIKGSVLDFEALKKAMDLLGFEAVVNLEEGIKRTAEFYLEHA
jgi:UDP-glucose 4-epimerase